MIQTICFVSHKLYLAFWLTIYHITKPIFSTHLTRFVLNISNKWRCEFSELAFSKVGSSDIYRIDFTYGGRGLKRNCPRWRRDCCIQNEFFWGILKKKTFQIVRYALSFLSSNVNVLKVPQKRLVHQKTIRGEESQSGGLTFSCFMCFNKRSSL